MSFQKFEYKELVDASGSMANAAGSSGGLDVKEFKSPELKFQAKQKIEAQNVSGTRFKLDTNVSAQLGVEERERLVAEDRIKKEIERQWEQVAEKAEVSGYTK